MQNAVLFDNMPASLAEKVQEYAQQTATKARNICSRNSVPQDVADVFIADAIDILRAQYDGLRATTEQMRVLTERVPQRSWDRTENAALCFIARYYADIIAHVDGSPSLGGGFIEAVVTCEQIKRMPADYIIDVDEDTMQQIRDDAQRLYYTYAMLIIGEWCNATPDELRGIRPRVGLTEQKRDKLIVFALDAQQQRKRIEEAHANKPPRDAPLRQTGDMFRPATNKKAPATHAYNKTIMQYQNMAYAEGNGIQTADNMTRSGMEIHGKFRPIFQGIIEQRQAAKALLTDGTATDEQRAQAAERVADTYAVQQAIDAIQLLPQIIKPISGSTEYSGYIATPRELYRIATGIESPNNEQLLRFLRGLAWLDTQRITITETTEKYVTERDSSGVIIRDDKGKPKRRSVKRDIVTNFRPLNVTFRTEYEDNAPVEKATQLGLMIHNYMRDGRTRPYVENGGKKEYITQPKQRYMQLEQYYQFTTEEERIFRSILLSKGKQAEDTLLSAVFNYPKRKAEAEQRAADACAIAEEMQRNPTATPEQKKQAHDEAEAAQTNARYSVVKNMGRDYDKLAGMFEKAQDCGLITYYVRRSAAGAYKPDKYGRGFVWEWRRPDAEEVKQRKQK